MFSKTSDDVCKGDGSTGSNTGGINPAVLFGNQTPKGSHISAQESDQEHDDSASVPEMKLCKIESVESNITDTMFTDVQENPAPTEHSEDQFLDAGLNASIEDSETEEQIEVVNQPEEEFEEINSPTITK